MICSLNILINHPVSEATPNSKITGPYCTLCPSLCPGALFLLLKTLHSLLIPFARAAKTLYRKFETNIPRNETARYGSQYLHSCFGERFTYSLDRSIYSAAGK